MNVVIVCRIYLRENFGGTYCHVLEWIIDGVWFGEWIVYYLYTRLVSTSS
jgi:hypothetical protein